MARGIRSQVFSGPSGCGATFLIGGALFMELQSHSLFHSPSPSPWAGQSSESSVQTLPLDSSNPSAKKGDCPVPHLFFLETTQLQSSELGGLLDTLESNMLFPELTSKGKKIKSKVASCSVLKQKPRCYGLAPPGPNSVWSYEQ